MQGLTLFFVTVPGAFRLETGAVAVPLPRTIRRLIDSVTAAQASVTTAVSSVVTIY